MLEGSRGEGVKARGAKGSRVEGVKTRVVKG